jgi:hypothetical protein
MFSGRANGTSREICTVRICLAQGYTSAKIAR